MWNVLPLRDRHLYQIKEEFEKIGELKILSKEIIFTAINLYTDLYTEIEKKKYGAKKINIRVGLKSACLYFACKKLNVPREKKEISEIFKHHIKYVTKGCNIFLDVMGEQYIKMEPFKAIDFIPRFTNLLGINKYQDTILSIVNFLCEKDSFVDMTPSNVACTSIYFINLYLNLGLTKQVLSKKCGTSVIIITKLYNNMLQYNNELENLITKKKGS
jgi:transcription initiation factor TFIIIB Brf1 subunit/transcription initiation factor TFIIB